MYKLLVYIFFINLLLKYVIIHYFDSNNLAMIASRTILTLIIIYFWFYRKNNHFDTKYILSSKWLLISLICVVAVYVMEIINEPNYLQLSFFTLLLKCFSVAILEELLFRYIIYRYYVNQNIIKKVSILNTSIIFALFHFANLINGSDFYSVIIQIQLAFLIGFLLQLIFIKSKSLVLIISIHAIINFVGSINQVNSSISHTTLTIDDFMYNQIFIMIIYIFFIPIYILRFKSL